jgi:hypothetical protein
MKYDFIVRTGVTDLNGRKFDNSSMSGYQEFQMTLFGA